TELGAARRRLEEAAGAEAARRSREILAAATRTLADRLQVIARAALERLRQDAADGLFEALAAELPPRQWQLVRVNPADEQRARVLFPQAEIVGDAGISGGMTVEAEGGRIRVSNTLETRLDAAWPDVVPGLVAGILAENSDDRAAA
ncbi:MAG: V-type ATP synthase subunit E family protein, partial [Steroidobacteraceae bacterium]